MKRLNRYRIGAIELEDENIKETVDTGSKIALLRKWIGEMATEDLDIIFTRLLGERKPTAEELVEEENKKWQ